MNERHLVVAALLKAGFTYEDIAKMEQIPNQYGGAWNTPWYRVKVPGHDAVLTFGSRKRVFSIKVEGIDEIGIALLDQELESEQTNTVGTEGSYLIHARGDRKSDG